MSYSNDSPIQSKYIDKFLIELVNYIEEYNREEEDNIDLSYVLNTQSYKIIEELNNVFVDNEFIIEPVNLTDEDFNSIKQELITFFEKAIQSMEQMTSESYNKDNQPQMLDINGQPVVDKKLPKNAYNDLKKYIPIYKKILQSLELIKTIEDFDDFYSVLKEVYNLYTNNISTLTGASINVIFWNSDINRKINFIQSK